MSFAQQRLWFIEQYEQGTAAYHIPMVLKLHQPKQAQTLVGALQLLVQRHKTLRTFFSTDDDDQPLQQVQKDPLPVERKTLAKAELNPALSRSINTPFNLSTQYPLRVVWFTVDNPSGAASETRQGRRHFPVTLSSHCRVDSWSGNSFQRADLLMGVMGVMGVMGTLSSHQNTPETTTCSRIAIDYLDFTLWQGNLAGPAAGNPDPMVAAGTGRPGAPEPATGLSSTTANRLPRWPLPMFAVTGTLCAVAPTGQS